MTLSNRFNRRCRDRLLRSRALVAAIMLLFGASVTAQAAALDDIHGRGVLVVGTKGDYRPFGFHDDKGDIVGFEPELAGEVAKALGVSLKLVPVVATTRIQLLNSGDIDLVMATMNVTAERAKQVTFVEPSYYASGVNVLAPKSAHLRVWQQLRDKPVCTVEGSFFIAELKDRYGPDIHLYKDTNQVYAAVKSGECVAAYDDTALIGQLQTPAWQDYEMPLRSILLQPWGIAVKQGNADLAARVGQLVKGWHATGRIEALERTWQIPSSVFAEEMHRRFAEGE